MSQTMLLSKIVNLMQRLLTGLASRWRNLFYRVAGVQMHGYNWLRAVEIPRDHHNIKLESCSLDRGVVLLCGGPAKSGIKLSIGPGTYINRNTFLDAVESLVIGSRVAIGPGCYITDHDHGIDPSRAPLDQDLIASPTSIGDEAWIGANVVILKGVTIGQRTIVGAGSVVTKSLPSDVVAVGVPAKVIRTRASATTQS
jgi:acetyltransferase-like isoleucine patch superfamily enzyme